MSSAPLTLVKFRRWLDRQSPRRRFGTRSDSCCPLARFLQEQRGRRALVGNLSYWVPVKGSSKRTQHTNPEWAKRFVTGIDRYGFKLSTVKVRDILRETAYRRA